MELNVKFFILNFFKEGFREEKAFKICPNPEAYLDLSLKSRMEIFLFFARIVNRL